MGGISANAPPLSGLNPLHTPHVNAITDTQRALTPRVVFLTTAGIGIAWQVFVITRGLRYGPELQPLLQGLGVIPPFLTRSFLASYRWWGLAPVLTVVLVADVARRAHPPLIYGSAVLAGSLLAGLVLQAWMIEAWFAPLLAIIVRVQP